MDGPRGGAPEVNPDRTTVRVGAIGDVHYDRHTAGKLHELFRQVHGLADILVLCGDLTDYGLEEEARLLAKDLADVRIPILAVLGNHDHENGSPEAVELILRDHGVHVLDGENTVVSGVGFAGVKGFGGGFGKRSLDPWGERTIKQFVQESVNEVLKLERALARLHTPSKVAITHYAPIAGTLEGEPLEIWPFLGTSRLEEVLDRYEVTVAFHGHVHAGSPEGRTRGGVPVYNVAMPVLKRALEGAPPLRVFEVEAARTHTEPQDQPSEVSD